MKGISPLIAGVFLIAITVTIAMLVTAWSTAVTSSAQAGISNKSSELTGCSGAAIDIETVYLVGTTNATATAVVKNSGLVNDLQIISAQLFLANGTNISAQSLPVTNFDRGNIVALSFRNVALGSSCPGNFSRVSVESTCPGAADMFDAQYESPKCA
mgnify:CR=1 FL=1